LRYLECALRLTCLSPALHRDAQLQRLAQLSRQRKWAAVGDMLDDVGRAPLRPLARDICSDACALQQLRLLIVRGDVCRRQGAGGFTEADEYYRQAAEVLIHVARPAFVAPLSQLLGGGALDAPEVVPAQPLAAGLAWRRARLAWLRGNEADALRQLDAAAALPGASEEHAMVHYRLAHGLLKVARDQASDQASDQAAAEQHLRAALGYLERSPHPKLRRNALRSLAACSSADGRERAWMACQSVGAAMSSGLLAKVEAMPNPPKGAVAALSALVSLGGDCGPVQKAVDQLPADWTVAVLCWAPQGNIVVARFRVCLGHGFCSLCPRGKGGRSCSLGAYSFSLS